MREIEQSLRCADRCCLDALQQRVQMDPSGHRIGWDGLRAVVDRDEPAHLRALAARWLAGGRQREDVPRLEKLLDQTAAVMSSESGPEPQRAVTCAPVVWIPRTLREAAFDAIRSILGRSFPSIADYRAWRSANPDLAHSYDYWQYAPDGVAELRTIDPELYARVLATSPALFDKEGDERSTRALHEAFDGDRLLALLERRASFPELLGEPAFSTFSVTVLEHAERLFEPRHSAPLAALLERGDFSKDAPMRATLAVAVSRLVPAEGRAVLVRALDARLTEHAVVLREVARRYAQEERRTLAAWYYGERALTAAETNGVATAIITGLGEAGPTARPILGALVLSHPPPTDGGGARPIKALAGAVRAMGGTLSVACDEDLVGGLAKVSQEEQARRAAAAQGSRTSCLEQAVAWLRERRDRP